MKTLITALLTAICSITASAQHMPIGLSIQAEATKTGSENYSLTNDGEPVASGKLKEDIRAKLTVGYMMPVSRKLTLGLSAYYDYNNEHLSGITDAGMMFNDNHHSFKGNLNVMYRTTLWKKTLMMFSTIGLDASQWGFERVSGVGAALLMLKMTKDTQLGIGPLVLINTGSRLPALFVIIYRHVFSPHWTLNLNHPFFSMQYTPSPKHTISGGFAFTNDYYWLQPAKEDLPKTVFFRRSLVRSGINYDFKISPTLTFSAQGGWEYTMRGGLYSANGREQIYDLNHPHGPYACMRLSFNPETKLTKKIKAMMAKQSARQEPEEQPKE